MADDNKYNDDEKSSKKSGEFRVPPRTWIVWIAIFGGIILLMLAKEKMSPPKKLLSQYDFFQKVESNLIASATVNYVAQSAYLREIEGTYYELDGDGNKVMDNGQPKKTEFRTKARLTEKMEDKLFALDKFEAREPNTFLLSLGYQLLIFLGIGLILWFFFIRQI